MSILNTPELMKLWQDAQSNPEWAATRFWEYLFNQVVFADRKWSVASQQPPTRDPTDLRRVDLVVERISDSAIVLFLEAKRAQATQNMLQEVENQAFTACCAKLYETGAPAIWAMTCVGTQTRLWAYRYDTDYLTAYYPLGCGLSEFSEYVDISTGGRHILEALNYIKSNPIPPDPVFDTPASPRPTHAVLPAGWHDREVDLLMAAARQGASGQEYSGAGPSSLELATPMEVDATGTVGQPDQPQLGVLVVANCMELVLEKISEGQHKFRRPDGKAMIINPNEWAPYYIDTPGGRYGGYGYTGKNGAQYYTWSLELTENKSAGKQKKKKP